MDAINRIGGKMTYTGVCLNTPVDAMPANKVPVMENLRGYEDGTLQPRPGLVDPAVTAMSGSVHSVARMNDPIPGAAYAWIRIAGAGTSLYSGQKPAPAAIDSGYDGNPVSIIPYRPPNSPEAWAYIANANKMRKTNISGVVENMGVATPNTETSVVLGVPGYVAICDFSTITGWVGANFGSGIAHQYRVNTTITSVFFDSGTSGWASIVPDDMTGISAGCLLWDPSISETIRVRDLIKTTLSTTIEQIIYDSGTTGPCSIYLADSATTIEVDTLIQLNSGEYVRVLSVSTGPDGTRSIRCSTVSNHVASQTVVGTSSFRAYCVGTAAAADMLVAHEIYGTTSATATPCTMTFTGSIPDYGTIGGRAVSDDDYMHISLQVNYPKNVTLIRVMLDPFNGLFNDKYYFKDFTPADLVAGIYVTDFSELSWRLSDMTKYGTSDDFTLLTASAALRIEVTVSAAVEIAVSSWWVGGTYGPDAGTLPMYYRYRARSTATGAKSNPSPATRGELYPLREKVIVTAPVHSDSQVDQIDFFRFGGALTSWKYVGSAANTGTPTLEDEQDDISLANAEDLEEDNFVPFPTIDLPRSGTCKVAGTSVYWLTGDAFNSRWGAGSQILIDGIAFELDRSPVQLFPVLFGSLIQLNENAGASASVAWSMPNPTLLSQPMGRMWGPYGETLFACGDPMQPGVLHCTTAGSPDTAPEEEQYEITNPSEPLMNGGVYDDKPFVFSSNRLFAFLRTADDTVGKRWSPQVVPNSKGIVNPWMLAVGSMIYFGAADGIYQTILGGEPESITRGDLYNLFPHEGQVGVAVNGFYPPDLTQPCQLNYAEGYLYFDYIDTNATKRTMTYRVDTQSWIPDVHPQGAVTHYGEQGAGLNSLLIGCADGKLYTVGGTDDAGTAISWKLQLPSNDAGESRLVKQWSDSILDVNPVGSNVSITPGFNNHTVLLAAQVVTGAVRAQKVIDFGTLQEYRNVSAFITGTGQAVLYEWQPSYLIKTESANKTYSLVFGSGFNFFDYFQIAHKSSAAWNLTIVLDGGAPVTIPISSSGGIYRKDFVRVPVSKFKSCTFAFPVGVQVYGPDCEVWCKAWGDDGPFKPQNPFADMGVPVPSVHLIQ
jgi:hypothetical protein